MRRKCVCSIDNKINHQLGRRQYLLQFCVLLWICPFSLNFTQLRIHLKKLILIFLTGSPLQSELQVEQQKKQHNIIGRRIVFDYCYYVCANKKKSMHVKIDYTIVCCRPSLIERVRQMESANNQWCKISNWYDFLSVSVDFRAENHTIERINTEH